MKKIAVALLILIAVIAVSLAQFLGNAEQGVEMILESELLRSRGLEAQIPDDSYYRFLDGRVALEIALRVPGIYGAYYFTPGGWTDVLIAELVEVSEAGMRFAKDWLGISVNEPLSFVFNATQPDSDHPFPIWSGGAVLGTSTYISMNTRRMPALIVHEAVHAILRYDERLSNFPMTPENSRWHGAMFLEEGLANVVEFLFFAEAEHRYYLHGRSNRRQVAENYLHNAALRTFRHNDNFEDEAEFGTRYPELMSYETAASFIYFLLTYHGSVEDFLRVFDDIDLMEEVYGRSMDDMIGEWLAYLDGFR